MNENELIVNLAKFLLIADIESEGHRQKTSYTNQSTPSYGNDHAKLVLDVISMTEIPQHLFDIFNKRIYRDGPALSQDSAESVIYQLEDSSKTISKEIIEKLGFDVVLTHWVGGGEGGGENVERVYSILNPADADELRALLHQAHDVHRQREIINNSMYNMAVSGHYASYCGIEWNDEFHDAKCEVKEMLVW